MKRILLCTDGSSYSSEASRYAAWLSRETGAEVTALYVSDLRRFEMPAIMDVGGSIGIQPYQNLITTLQETEKYKAEFIEKSCRNHFDDAGIVERLTFVSDTGLLVDTIQDYEKEHDLIILGKRGESAEHATEHIGSTLERVVRVSQIPCLVTNRKYRKVSKVAFAHDGGSSCRKLLSVMKTYEWLKAMPLHLLSVAEDNNEDEVSHLLREAEDELTGAGYKVRTEMLSGVPEDAISDYVEDTDIDLLLMGAYGHTRIRRFLIGSTTSETLRRCRIPVLCYHPVS